MEQGIASSVIVTVQVCDAEAGDQCVDETLCYGSRYVFVLTYDQEATCRD